ncbi:glycerophosphodiester phosphodiesterase [Carnobacterium maltaromaticum]|uniref:glycerophosphodiester phosphodiesterase n=1 Tax=Carnobacterium maltaromaticum TaxID=2751 RepID=UPI0007054F2A|nr:glycerophosphodiester phosphodiesterase [Carnobacterium maltaromaticum]KRN72232.1 glycerophosphodiester phosphodiesterase [Carnobacterium maltaromaticum]MBC9809378.1 glycerophosphodiester phosphodiesterase [Carnobacterium maltaromaticum]CRH17166.1 Glycerophosphoryl diester phosphodiesterase family protein [Carnobacterium maltaromaticum]CRH23369.1 Glycerophosphoryl diester phosphodiesterase family protein [Carnobacterium maltaromaticum]
MSKTKIYAHRGASGEYPENTLLSFRKAIETGVDGIECDIHLTKDEELVVIHDEEVKRTFKGEGFVNDYTLDELRALTLAERYQQFPLYDRSWELEKIPTLEEVLKLLQGTEIELNIELKTTMFPYFGLAEKAVKLVKKYQYEEQVVYSSFHYPSLAAIKEVDTSAKIAWLVAHPVPRIWEYIPVLSLDGLHLSKEIGLSSDYAQLKGACQNLPIRLWTINSSQDMKASIGQDSTALMTDFPRKALEIRALFS